MALGNLNRPILASLSGANVEKTLFGLKRFTADNRWLSKNNRYVHNTKNQIQSEMQNGGIVHPRNLSQYIAASCLLHCSDGWSFLGKAISSLLRGDPHRACHLAYYAELRAAMSILATNGIGVFNNQHFVIDAPHSVRNLPNKSNTHEFVWDCLDNWAQSHTSGYSFADMIRPYGRNLDDWLTPIGGASSILPHARDWFGQWGMDLMFFSDDRNARNNSSYRPDGLHDVWKIDTFTALNFVKDLWVLLEPSPTSFGLIDQHILRLSLEGVFESKSGKSAKDDKIGFKNMASSVVLAQNLGPAIGKTWLNFLTRSHNGENPSIFTFSEQPAEENGESVFAIMSRAALLLRIASGANSKLFKNTGFEVDTLSFWWRRVGDTRGLWDEIDDTNELVNLWNDIADSIEDIESFQTAYKPENQSFYKFALNCGNSIPSISSFELPMIWNMTPA